jgi:NAD(P)-dependent dehydrogenase (short-subunit alcohol dehydrogenase family)
VSGGRLAGQVAVVTGASRGLGEAYARALVEAGAALVVSARTESALHELAESLPGAVVVAGDVSQPQTAQRIVDAALAEFGRIDAVVNNAGTLRDRTLLKMALEEFDEVMRSHVYGTFLVTQAAVGAMRDRGGGRVINVGSDSGMRGSFGQTNYAAAKGAIAGMTLTWARELPRYGITCNCVLPNAYTAMTESLEDLLEEYRYGDESRFPRALGQPREAAPLVVFLASKAARHLNGLFISLGGDKLSVWDQAREVRCAFKQGGWGVEDLEQSLEFALGSDLNAGWNVVPLAPSS